MKNKINFKHIFMLLLVTILLITGASCKSCKKEDPQDNNDPKDPVIPERVEIITEKNSISIGEELQITAKVYPETASQEVVWEIKQENEFASLNNSVLRGIKEGKVYLSCSCKDYKKIFDSKEIRITHPLLEEEIYKAYNIIGTFGSDASTTYSISHHCKNTKTYVLLTEATDPEFENAKRYYGFGTYFEDMDERIAGKFEGRNVWKTQISGLKPNTNYIYKVNNGDDTYSDIYHFKTADNSHRTTFLFNTDTHYSMLTDGSDTSTVVNEELVDSALRLNPNIQFILDGGDLIDTGGNSGIWEKFFNYAQCVKKLPFVSVPGNHEYYVSHTLQKDFRYFATHHASPLNGPEPLLGASCYFKHNDTLIIMIDNNNGIGYYEQYDWIENLLLNEDYKYSIVCFHSPIENNNADSDPKLVNLFQKYSVDLILDGHLHVHHYKPYLYDGQSMPEEAQKGVTYLTGTCSGVKGFRGKTHEEAQAFVRGYIVDITDEGIEITLIDATGKVLDIFHVKTRKTGVQKETTKEEIMSKLNFNYDKDNKQVNFTWDDTYYKNVKMVKVEEIIRNKITDYSVCPTPTYTDLHIGDIVEGYQYEFKVTVSFADGTKDYKTFNLDLHDSINLSVGSKTDNSLTLNFNGTNESMNFMVKEYNIYVNGVLYSTISYIKGYNPVTNTTLYNLEKGKSYEIVFEAIDYSREKAVCYREKINVIL